MYNYYGGENELENRISTGFFDLDALIGGIENGKVYMIAGRPSTGKSIFVVNIAAFAARNFNKNVLFFYLEGTKERFTNRLVSSECFVDYGRFEKGLLDDAEWKSVSNNIPDIFTNNIMIDDSSEINLESLKNKLDRASNIDMVIIDYLQLVDGNGDRKKIITDLLLCLRNIAQEKNLPILIVSSMSDVCEKRCDKRPILRDLNEDGILEQLTDVVMFLYRDNIYDPLSEKRNITEIIVARNRTGSVGVVEVAFIPSRNKFANLEKV